KLFARQMLECWQPVLGLSVEENERAVEAGYKAWHEYENSMRKRARDVLDMLERENRLGIVMLARPYHHDPGLNHGVLEELQKRGYPVFSQNNPPCGEDLLVRVFGEEFRAGNIRHPLDLSPVSKTAPAASSNM